MEYFEKKITYLRGLCDGSGFAPDSKEGKIFHEILNVLDDMAFMLETFLDDEDMELMEDDEDADEPIFLYSFLCPGCGEKVDLDEETMETQFETTCPKCGITFSIGTADIATS